MSALQYKREIDGLRAIAVLGVVLFHAEPTWLPGGFLGVDVFFVISGYLITSLLLLEHRRSGTLDLTAFYARRMRRLLPALGVMVLATVLAGLWLIPDDAQRDLLRSAAASLLFLGNVYFQANTGDYFDTPTDEVPLLHLWSLGVEEQFYLVLPLLLLWMARRGTRGLVNVLVGASVVSLLLAEHWIQIRPSIAFYQMPARFWEFAAGALVAIAPRERLRPQVATALAWTGLGTVIAAMAVGSPMHFPGVGALPVVLGSAVLVWSLHDGARLSGACALLGARPMVFVGMVSYSLYLWHWPLLAILRVTTFEPSLAARLGACAVAIVLAWASHRYIETPFRRRPLGSTSQRRTVALGAGASAALALALAGTGQVLRPAPLPTPTGPQTTALDRPTNMHTCHFGLDADIDHLQPVACNSDPAKPASIILWGDSHAVAWQPFAWSVATASATAAASFTLDSCPPISNFDTWRADFPKHRDNCRRFNALATDYVRRKAPDEVILAGRWLLYFQTRPANGMRPQSPESFEQGISQAVDEIAPHTKKVVLMGPLPALEAPAPRCLSAPDAPRCAMPRQEYDRLAARVWGAFRKIASRHPNVELIDPADFFCGAERCPAARDGYALFWDTNHVSTHAARQFARMYLADPARWRVSAPLP